MTGALSKLLTQASLVLATVPSASESEQAIDERIAEGNRIEVMYGETYDVYGPVLDSLKYYFAVAAVGRALARSGAIAQPTILIADVASCRNEPEEKHDELMSLGANRARLVKSISETYSLGLDVLLMSEYLYSDAFQSRLSRIRSEAGQRSEIYEWVRQTVPASKVKIEEEKDFAYAFEEIATIIEYDIKVGPPREKFYDEPTRMIGKALGYKSLLSVYLHPTYPLGFSFDFFFANEEIEQYGVTPYKAGSKGLMEHRIVLGQTPRNRVSTLIDQSFVSKKASIPNPILDLAVIIEMARQWLEHEEIHLDLRERFYGGGISPKELKEFTCDGISRYILDPIASII